MKETSEKSVTMYGVVPASKIIGETVVNYQGENVGKIHELVIDARKNRVAYAVLSFGGFLGMGNKLFAMPWEAFEFSTTEHKLILNVDKEKLKTASFGERASTTTTITFPLGSHRIDDFGVLVKPTRRIE
jgi:sporulation protein YlmC with PRC-barrel domain